MFLPYINKRLPGGVFRQMLKQIIQKIDSGVLHEGYVMPSSRELAQKLGINRSTVVKVYEELWALGYLESTPGSYTRVRRRMPMVLRSIAVAKDVEKYSDILSEVILRDPATSDPSTHLSVPRISGCIDLQRLEPDTSLIDRQQFISWGLSYLAANSFKAKAF